MTGIVDHVSGAESDSGFYAVVPCPKCGGTHHATVSSIGWFLFECRTAVVSGHVARWRLDQRLVRKGEGGTT